MKLHKISKEKRQELFIKDLKALLEKYDVEICLTDVGDQHWPEYTMVAEFKSNYKDNKNYVEFSELDLGSYIDKDKKI